MPTHRRICLNCEDESFSKRAPLCKSCLRMAFITALVTSSGTEIGHQLNLTWIVAAIKAVFTL